MRGSRETGSLGANTFYQNGALATGASPAEINLDASGSGGQTDITANLFSLTLGVS